LFICTAVLLSLSLGRRWYYMLPVLMPLVLLMADAAVRIIHESRKLPKIWTTVVLATHMAAIAGVGVVLFQQHDLRLGRVGDVLSVVVVGCSFLAIIVVMIGARRRSLAISLIALVAFSMLSTILMEWSGVLWRTKRFERQTFVTSIEGLLTDAAPLIGWRDEWPEEQYYLHRIIPRMNRVAEVKAFVQEHGPTWILVDTQSRPLPTPKRLNARVVQAFDFDGSDDRLQLWLINATSGNEKLGGHSGPSVSWEGGFNPAVRTVMLGQLPKPRLGASMLYLHFSR